MATQAGAPLGQQARLVGHRHGGRVDLERARPADRTVRGFGGELHPTATGLVGEGGHLPGLADEVRRLLRPDVDRRGETHRTIDHDAHTHAEVGVVGRGLGQGVAQADCLATDALDPQLGGLATGGGVERGVGQSGELVGGKRHQGTGVG